MKWNQFEITQNLTIPNTDIILEKGDIVEYLPEAGSSVNFRCMECDKLFKSTNIYEPKCPRCGSYDIDVAY